MRTSATIVLVVVLLVVAAAPWIMGSCVSEPLLPDDYQRARDQYDQMVATAQMETREAERRAPSDYSVVAETAAPSAPGLEPSAIPATATHTPEATEASLTSVPPIAPTTAAAFTETVASTVTAEVDTAATPDVIVRPGTSAEGGGSTARVTVVRSGVVTESIEPGTAISQTHVITTSPHPGYEETEDVLTEVMMTERVRQDLSGQPMRNLVISLTPNGWRATAEAAAIPGIYRPVVIAGTLAIEDESLVAKVSSILFDGFDVTGQYRSQFEQTVKSSLYRLLPQRFVQSYELSDGQILVHSLVRP